MKTEASNEPVPLRILLVEDQAADAELCVRALRQAGFAASADRVDSAVQFEQRLAGPEYDIVLADYSLPGWGGLDALRILRERNLDLPFILVTGTAGEETAVDCIKEGAADYVLKDRLVRLPFAVERALREKKQARERADTLDALERSERDYRTLFESANVAILIFDCQSATILDANQAACYIYGLSRPRLVGASMRIFTPADSNSDALLDELHSSGSCRNVEMTHLSAAGRVLEMLVSASLVEYQGRRAVLMINRDITARKHAENEVRRLVRSLGARVREATALHRAARLLQDTSRNTRLLLREVVSLLPEACQYPEITAARISFDEFRCFTPNFSETEWRLEEALETADGKHGAIEIVHLEPRPIENEGPFLAEERSLIRAITGMLRTYFARKKAEEALRASEERYRNLFENANDLIYSHDLAGRFTSWNRAGERITGYSKNELASLSVEQLLTPESGELVRKVTASAMAGTPEGPIEIEILAKDGRRVAIEVSGGVIHTGAGPEIQGVARDITERKELEERLRQAEKMEAVGRLAGGVAHDFNNLLMVISGYGELLQEQVAGNSRQEKPVREILKATERAATLTRHLLAFSRRQVLQPRVLDLNGVVAGMEGMLARLVREDIQLTSRLAAGLRAVKADPGQIEQVIMNLVVNARDAMPGGGRLLIETSNTELDTTLARQPGSPAAGSYVLLTVSDSGQGMDAETLSHIFEPFYSTKSKRNGTGLGLATVYGIAQQSHGHISVYSKPDRGATFKVYLPAACEQAPEEANGEERAPAPVAGPETVLPKAAS